MRMPACCDREYHDPFHGVVIRLNTICLSEIPQARKASKLASEGREQTASAVHSYQNCISFSHNLGDDFMNHIS